MIKTNNNPMIKNLVEMAENIKEKSELELFSDFYNMQNGQPMSEIQKTFIHELIEEIWRGEK